MITYHVGKHTGKGRIMLWGMKYMLKKDGSTGETFTG